MRGPYPMPLYDYRCPEGDVVEKFFSMHDKPDTVSCPQCGQTAASLIPAVGPSQMRSRAMRALDATKATADTPQVVNAVSGTRTGRYRPTTVNHNPTHYTIQWPYQVRQAAGDTQQTLYATHGSNARYTSRILSYS